MEKEAVKKKPGVGKTKRKGGIMLFLMLIGLLLFANGNRKEIIQQFTKENAEEKIKDLDLTVVSEGRMPEALKKYVDEKKTAPFKCTYQDGDYLYICVGYGEKPCGGYSIRIEDLYLADNAIYVQTMLEGNDKEEMREGVKSYPYIVMKTEYLDYAVVFK